MALFFADLVREACRATGGGALALDGALPGHRSFAATVPPGERFHYAIAGITHTDQWETGEGEIAGGLLVREPIASSAAGAAVDFSPGLKTVALTVCADWFAARDHPAAIGDIPGLEEALAGKAATGHDHDGAYQPLDADLSAIAGLTTTAFGRAQLALADAAALRGHAGLGSLATQAADSVAISGGSIGGIVDLPVADGGTGASSAPAARANLGLGSAATKDVGTSGDAVPVLNGAATSWAAGATFGGALTVASGGAAITGDLSVSGAISIAGSTLAARSGNYHVISRPGGAALYLGNASDPTNYHDNANHNFRNAAGTSSYALLNATALGLSSGLIFRIGGIQVVGARRTGWTAASGTATRTSFDTATATTAALAERLKALIDDLIAHGLIGS